ncbi:hypothetical protein TL16_g13249 [Triparma laevis f. inornata]|uniref:Uncharacterized protein n=1 Tax=Triparma laevis f. inornata TaxID=1714386 RepID=A0A9W7BYG5_9STRA|nr:hypothetical protein TL16_g13249 [Triparma laevis f. inornata]
MSAFVDTSNIPPAFQLSCSNFGLLTTSFLSDLTQTVPVDGSLCFLPVQGTSVGPITSITTPSTTLGYTKGTVSLHTSFYQLVRKSRQNLRTIYLPQFGPIQTVLHLTETVLAILPNPSIDVFLSMTSPTEGSVLCLGHESKVNCMVKTDQCLFTASADGSLRCYVLFCHPIKNRVMKKIDRMYSELSRGIEAENKNPHYTQLKTGEEILSLQTQSYGDGEDCNGGEGLIWIGLVDKSVTLVKYGIQMGLSAGGGPTTVLENMYNVKLTGVPSCIATEEGKVCFGCFDGSIAFNEYVASYGDGVIRCFKEGERGVGLVAEMRGDTGVVDILKKGTGVAICYENGVLQEYGYEDLPSVTPKVPSSIEPVHGVEEGDDFFKNVIREATSSMELESEEEMKRWVKDVKRNKGKKVEEIVEESEEENDESDDDEEEYDESAFEEYLVAKEPNMSLERRESLKAERRASVKAEKKAQRRASLQNNPDSANKSPKDKKKKQQPNKNKKEPPQPQPRSTPVPQPTPLPNNFVPHPLSKPSLQSTLHYQSDLPNSAHAQFDPRTVETNEESRVFAARVSSNVDPKARLYSNLVSLSGDVEVPKKVLEPQIRKDYILQNIRTSPMPSDLIPEKAEENVKINEGKGKERKHRMMVGRQEGGKYGGKHVRRGVKAL